MGTGMLVALSSLGNSCANERPHPGVSLAHEVHLACCLVDAHILQHGAKADGLVDLRLTGGLQPDALGVAPALNVENT